MTKIDKWRDADGRTADPYAGLRAAIEGLPKVRQWFVVGPPWGNGDFIVSGHPDPHIGKYVCDTENFDGEGEAVLEHAAYIAEANPAAIRTLLAERDSLAGEVARLNGEASVMRDLLRECHGVIRTIEAESSEEADLLATLVADVERAIVPNTRDDRADPGEKEQR